MPDNNNNKHEQGVTLKRVQWGVINYDDERLDIEGLSDAEVGIYWRMKLKYIERRGLPSCLKQLYQMFASDRPGKRAVDAVLKERFTIVGDRLCHTGCDNAIAEADQRYRKRSVAGRLGAKSRWGDDQQNDSNAMAMPMAMLWQADGVKSKESEEVNTEEKTTTTSYISVEDGSSAPKGKDGAHIDEELGTTVSLTDNLSPQPHTPISSTHTLSSTPPPNSAPPPSPWDVAPFDEEQWNEAHAKVFAPMVEGVQPDDEEERLHLIGYLYSEADKHPHLRAILAESTKAMN